MKLELRQLLLVVTTNDHCEACALIVALVLEKTPVAKARLLIDSRNFPRASQGFLGEVL